MVAPEGRVEMPYRVLPGGASSSRVYLVDAGGNGDFRSVQAAINAAAAQSPLPDDRWLVLVGPGVYRESLSLSDHVDVSGLSPGAAAVIRAPEGQSAVAVPASCWLANLRLAGTNDPLVLANTAGVELYLEGVVIAEDTPGAAGLKLSAAGQVTLRGCDIQAGGNGVQVGAGVLRAYNSRLAHYHAVAGADPEYAVQVDGGTAVLELCVVENLGPAGAGALLTAEPELFKLVHCTVRKASGAYSVDAALSCPNAGVFACALNAALSSNIGSAAGNTVHAGV
jgi:hypothetical protein